MNTGVPVQQEGNSVFALDHIQNPNRLWALPVIGGVTKNIILLPIALWLLIVLWATFALSIINGFIVFFTGAYWRPAYTLAVGSMRLTAKANCFFLGLSDRYPWFSLDSGAEIRLEVPMPTRPNRLLAVPLAGGVFRFAVLVPCFIYMFVMGLLVYLLFWLTWAPVLLLGQYPEGLFNVMIYYQRLQLRVSAYTFGLSDSYPLFDDGLGPDEWGPGRHDRVFRPLP